MSKKSTGILLASFLTLGMGSAWADSGRHGHERRGHDGYSQSDRHGYGHNQNRNRGHARTYYQPAYYQPRVVRRDYRYVYYPQHNVYYAPGEQVWYVHDRNNWQPRHSRPRNDLYGGVNVVLNIPLY